MRQFFLLPLDPTWRVSLDAFEAVILTAPIVHSQRNLLCDHPLRRSPRRKQIVNKMIFNVIGDKRVVLGDGVDVDGRLYVNLFVTRRDKSCRVKRRLRGLSRRSARDESARALQMKYSSRAALARTRARRRRALMAAIRQLPRRSQRNLCGEFGKKEYRVYY